MGLGFRSILRFRVLGLSKLSAFPGLSSFIAGCNGSMGNADQYWKKVWDLCFRLQAGQPSHIYSLKLVVMVAVVVVACRLVVVVAVVVVVVVSAVRSVMVAVLSRCRHQCCSISVFAICSIWLNIIAAPGTPTTLFYPKLPRHLPWPALPCG